MGVSNCGGSRAKLREWCPLTGAELTACRRGCLVGLRPPALPPVDQPSAAALSAVVRRSQAWVWRYVFSEGDVGVALGFGVGDVGLALGFFEA